MALSNTRLTDLVARVLFLSLLLATGCKSNQSNSAGALISAYQNSCQSAGTWTQAALSSTQSLISVIQSIQSNDACKAYGSVLSNIASAGSEIQSTLTNQAYLNYRQAQDSVQQLTLALANAPAGGTLATQLSQQLVTAQVNLVNMTAANEATAAVTGQNQFANSSLALSTYTQSILSNTSGIEQCLTQSPQAAVELATNLLALGGSFISPLYGAAASSVGELINLGVEAARTSSSNDALWSLYSTEMPTALGCGLESMTELYCDANDAFDLLQLQASSYPNPGSLPDPIWQGLDLEGRRLPILNAWLSQVRNGTLPSDPTEAQKQDAAWAQLEALDSFNRDVYGELTHDQALYEAAAGDAIAQQNILVTAIYNVANMLSATPTAGQSNPFGSLNANLDQVACWLVAGYTNAQGSIVACAPDSQTVKNQQYISQTLIPAYQPTMTTINTHFSAIYTVVQNQVAIDFANTITQDPTPVLASALQAAPGSLSPLQVMQGIIDYLNAQLQSGDGSNPQSPALLKETIGIFQQAIAVIQSAPTEASTPDMKIRTLFDLFQLEPGLQFVDGRIGDFVQWDLDDRISKGELPTNVSDILKVAGGDIQTVLLQSGVTNLDSVSADLNNSRAIMAGNIQTFRTYFEPSFSQSVTELAQEATSSGEPATGPNRPFGQTLGHLCTLLLASGQAWPSSVSWQICSQASLSSIYPDPTGSLTIQLAQLQKSLSGASDQTRFCAYHRFLRAGKLAEILSGGTQPSNVSAQTLGLQMMDMVNFPQSFMPDLMGQP